MIFKSYSFLFFIADSTDNSYNKTFYAVYGQYYRAHFFGTYSFCIANDLQIPKFDSQDEHDKFMAYCKANADAISGKSLGLRFNIYVDAFSRTAPNASGYVWYTSGGPMNQLNIDWATGEPNNMNGGSEYCATVLRNGAIGMNDYACNLFTLVYFSPLIVCQKTTWISAPKGLSNKYQ